MTPRNASLVAAGSVVASSFAAPEPAAAVDLFPLDDIVGDVIGGAASFAADQVAGAAVASLIGIVEFLVGDISDDFSRDLVSFLLGLPDYTGRRYPELNAYGDYVEAIAWGLLALVLVGSALRYWAAGYCSASAGDALNAGLRTTAAAAALVTYEPAWHYATVGVNKLTWALATGPGIDGSVTRLFDDALAFVVPTGSTPVFGGLILFGALGCSVWLLVTKVVLSAALAVLFLAAPLAIALSPLEDLEWTTGVVSRGVIAILCYPVTWTICFAAFALLSAAPETGNGAIADLATRMTGLAALLVAIKLPRMILERGLGYSAAPRPSQMVVSVRGIVGVVR